MSEYSISVVAPAFVDIIWDQVLPHLQRVVDVAHGEMTCDSVKKRLQSGDSVLVTISKGSEIVAINTLEIRVMDSGLRALFIPITGGNEMFKWKDDFQAMAIKMAKFYNCTELRGLAVREGWMDVLKPMGWEHVHEVIKLEIGDL